MPIRSEQRVNYDRIAHIYDEPARDHAPDPGLSEYLLEHPQPRRSDHRILNMGCGTGKRFTANRKIYPNLAMTGMDIFHGMLKQARKRCNIVHWVQGDSSATPFCESAFDYATNQFSYSHVLDKNRLFGEVFRILKRGGRYIMTHIDPWSMPDWLVYRYFPAAQQRDFKDFLTADSFVDRMLGAGFANILVKRTFRSEKLSLGEFLNYVSQRHRASQLMVISDQSYNEGVRALREEIKQLGESWCLESQLCLITISGDKPKKAA